MCRYPARLSDKCQLRTVSLAANRHSTDRESGACAPLSTAHQLFSGSLGRNFTPAMSSGDRGRLGSGVAPQALTAAVAQQVREADVRKEPHALPYGNAVAKSATPAG